MQYYDKLVVGNRIRKVRKQRNMTQSKLAEHLEYSNERQLQRIECGETGCSVDKLMEIAQILNISTDYLLFGMETNPETLYMDVFKNKNERQKIYLLKVLKVAAEGLEIL